MRPPEKYMAKFRNLFIIVFLSLFSLHASRPSTRSSLIYLACNGVAPPRLVTLQGTQLDVNLMLHDDGFTFHM